MSDNPEERRDPSATSPLEEHLDGHSIESLSDYLDRGRLPRDPKIESSPAAQNALAALSRLRAIAPRVLAREADDFSPQNDHWITRILDQIGRQAHAGRDIPIRHDVEGAKLSISEGAVRAIVREVGDGLDGLVVERCRLVGDVESLDAPVEVEIEVSTFEGLDVDAVTADFRERVATALALHTDLRVSTIAVRVRDTDLDQDDERVR